VKKSYKDLKNPNAQEEYRIQRQIKIQKIAEEKRREEDAGESRDGRDFSTIVASSSVSAPTLSTTGTAVAQVSSLTSSIDANESKSKDRVQKVSDSDCYTTRSILEADVSAVNPVPHTITDVPRPVHASKSTISSVKHSSQVAPQAAQSLKPTISTIKQSSSQAALQSVQSSKSTIPTVKQVPSQVIPQPVQPKPSTWAAGKQVLSQATIKARDPRVSSVQDFQNFHSEKNAKDLEKCKEGTRMQSTSEYSAARNTKMGNEKKNSEEDEMSDDSVVVLSPDRSRSSAVSRKKEDSSINDAKAGSCSSLTKDVHLDERGTGQRPHSKSIRAQDQSRTEEVQPIPIQAPNVDKAISHFNDSYANRHPNSISQISSNRSTREEREYEKHLERKSIDRSRKGDDRTSSSRSDKGGGKRKERTDTFNEDSINENRREVHTSRNRSPSHHSHKNDKSSYSRTDHSSDLSESRRNTQSSHSHPSYHVPSRQYIRSNNDSAPCRFFNSRAGCHNGGRCIFSHSTEDPHPYKKSRRD
jgi:hypothetical protein